MEKSANQRGFWYVFDLSHPDKRRTSHIVLPSLPRFVRSKLPRARGARAAFRLRRNAAAARLPPRCAKVSLRETFAVRPAPPISADLRGAARSAAGGTRLAAAVAAALSRFPAKREIGAPRAARRAFTLSRPPHIVIAGRKASALRKRRSNHA